MHRQSNYGKRWYPRTTGMQMTMASVLVVIIVLAIAGGFAYQSMGGALRSNAERLLHDTAMQAVGRLDDFLEQADMFTLQIGTASVVQESLQDIMQDEGRIFDAGNRMKTSLPTLMTFSPMIETIEVYSGDRRIYPLDMLELGTRLNRQIVHAADRLEGSVQWVSSDPLNKSRLLGVRQLRLIEREFTAGGYLLFTIPPSFLDFLTNEITAVEDSRILLLDDKRRIILSNNDLPVQAPSPFPETDGMLKLSEGSYVTVERHSALSDWSLVYMLPDRKVTESVALLRTALLAAGVIALVLSVALSYSASRWITSPIRSLIRTMRKSRSGKLQMSVDSYRNKDMSELQASYNRMVGNIDELITTVYEKEIATSRAELKALQAQIHPHFLYNTLEALYWSLMEKKEKALAKTVIDLSHLFRYTMDTDSQGDFVQMRQEIVHTERYVQIMRMRMGERLHYDQHIDDGLDELEVPKLIIQPLVENAIVHGIEPRIGSGHVTLTVKCDENLVQIIVRDDGNGMNEDMLAQLRASMASGKPSIHSKGTGFGLRNIHQRIHYYYGADYGMTIERAAEGGLRVQLLLPSRRGSI